MDPKYFPPADRQPIRQDRLWIGANVVTIASFLFPPGLTRQAICVPSLVAILYQIRTHQAPVTKPYDNYMVFVHVLWTLERWVDLSVCRTAEEEARRVDHGGREVETREDVRRMGVWEKAKWSVSLCTTLRGTAWNWRVKNVRAVEGRERERGWFLLRQVALIAQYVLMVDAWGWMLRHTVAGQVGVDGVGVLPNDDLVRFDGLQLWQQVGMTWAVLFNAGATLGVGYSIPAFLACLTPWWTPEDWPRVFGKWRDAWSVRNLWGRCWHQHMRRMFEVFNEVVFERVLKVRKGSFLSKYGKIWGAFFVSACFHHAGAMNLPYVEAVTGQFAFFTLQPVTIMVEDGVIALGKRWGVKERWWTRGVGYAWVVAWLSWSARGAARYFRESGLGREPGLIQVKLWDRILGS